MNIIMTGIEIEAIEGLVFAGLSAVRALLVSLPCFISSPLYRGVGDRHSV